MNVDVDVFARVALDPLVAALRDRVLLQYIGRLRRGLFQLHIAPYNPKDAETAIRTLVKLIRSLPAPARRRWDDASRRVFDIGFQGGFKPHSSEFDISRESVAAIASLGGSIKVTLYVAPAVESSAPSAEAITPSLETPGLTGDDALHPSRRAPLARRNRHR